MRPILLTALFTAFAATSLSAQEWASWRGADGNGVAPGNPPREWSETQNLRWKTEIPGLAFSSPVIWGNHVFLTTAIETNRSGDPTNLEPHDARSKEPPTAVWQFAVLALDRSDGSVAWSTTVTEVVPHEGGHAANSQASSSPITDGESIWVNFGSRGIYCLDTDGEIRWSKDLGMMRTRYQYGEGTSPAIHGDKLVINWDHHGDSFIATFDKNTGDELWRTPRDENTTWGTPIVREVDGRQQIVTNGFGASRGYDLETGDLIWTLGGMTELVIPTPVYADGIAYLMSGYPENSIQAVRLAGASGDLADSNNLLWSFNRNAPYVSSAVLHDGYVYFVRLVNGVLSCLDARTGEVQYEGQRLQGLRRVISSLVAAGGRIYVVAQDGTTKVVKLGPNYEDLATNKLEDNFDASPAIAGDELFLRGHRFLYCIAEG